VVLKFWWKEFNDEFNTEDGLYISSDAGKTFVKVMDLKDGANGVWKQYWVDLDKLATQNGLNMVQKFVVKFQQKGNGPAVTDGMGFDDISVAVQPFVAPPYSQDFEAGVFDEYWSFTSSTGFGRSSITNQYVPQGGVRHMTLDVSGCSAAYMSVNEAVVYLDLSAGRGVDLSFWWKEFNDEDHAEDGVYISDDGGLTWTKVLGLTGSTYNIWAQYTLDLLDLANQNNLVLNNRFAVKFQQKDDCSIAGGDGMAFDTITVYEKQAYAKLPYETSFEEGVYDFYWTGSPSNCASEINTNDAVDGSYQVKLVCPDDQTDNVSYSDLYLDLNGESWASLSFWWKNLGNASFDTEDGVFMSNDGGANFTRIMGFDGGDAGTWYYQAIDLTIVSWQYGLWFNSQVVIRFQYKGIGPGDQAGFGLDKLAVTRGPDYATIPYTNSFEDGYLDTEWTVRNDDGGRARIVVDAGNTGTNYLLLDNATCTGASTMAEAVVHINASSILSNAEFNFYWKNFGDEEDAQDGVYFSSDYGNSWVKVYDFLGGVPADWTYVSLDMDALAMAYGLSLNEGFAVKFTQADDCNVAGEDGIAIDDIEVKQVQPYTTIPYTQNFESGSFDQYWADMSTNSGRIAIRSSWTPRNSYHLTMDNGSNGGALSVNQARLHVNLENETDVVLSFYWKEWSDDNHANVDGVFISDDGGTTFVRLVDLAIDGTADYYYKFTIDLDAAVAAAGLTMSNTFVIKFQQTGNYAYSSDGFAFDDITLDRQTAAELPYSTGFESTTYDAPWMISTTWNGRIENRTDVTPKTGSRSMSFDNSGSVYALNEARLHLNLSEATKATLEFWWRETNEELHVQDGIFLSDNGGRTFVRVSPLEGSYNQWNFVQWDLVTLAAANGLTFTDRFVVKFAQYGNTSYANDGFQFDDLAVKAGPTYTKLPYTQTFETGKTDAYWTNFTNNKARIQVTTDNTPMAGSYHMVMDSFESIAAGNISYADLHVDLTGESAVDLDFWWKETNDETDSDDGVYFSADGGLTFIKAFDLKDGAASTWIHKVMSISDFVAANAQLEMNETFVIRFQNKNNNTFGNDGIAFDNVIVTQGVAYAVPPYAQDFNGASLDNYWRTSSTEKGRITLNANYDRSTVWTETLVYSDNGDNGSGWSNARINWNGCYYGSSTVHGSYWNDVREDAYTVNLASYPHSRVRVTLTYWASETWDQSEGDYASFALDSTELWRQYRASSGNCTGFGTDYGSSGQNCAWSNWVNCRYELDVTGDHTASNATIRVRGWMNGGYSDERWAFDNVRVYAVNKTGGEGNALTMDSMTSGTAGTNEARLHLNLAGATNSVLSVWWKEFNDQDNTEDGIWFSNDGGATFTEVMHLNGTLYTNNTWTKISIDLLQAAKSIGKTLTNKVVIKLQQRDTDLISSRGFAFDDLSISEQAYTAIPYSIGFDSSSFDQYWSYWSTGKGRVWFTNSYSPMGSQQAMMDTYASMDSTNSMDLHVKLAGETAAYLSFWWKEFNDETHSEDGVYFSNDGGATFKKIYNLQDGSNQVWYFYRLNLVTLATAQGLTFTDNSIVRFQQRGTEPVANDGFSIDDVRVMGAPTYATLPYTTGFETGMVDNSWITESTETGRVLVTNQNTPHAGTYHMTMDRADAPGSTAVNQAKLHLNLQDETKVLLSFWWKEYNDDTDTNDGLYISDNGGTTFTKVLDLKDWDTTWKIYTVDLVTVAAAAGKTLSDKFVVKWQEGANHYISNDGFALDDISVLRAPEYGTLPYYTGFETGNFDGKWTVSSSNRGRVQIQTASAPVAGSYHLTMDCREAGYPSLAEASLHLNFEGQSNIELAFWWREFNDEVNIQDGLWLSNDGGASFAKIKSFTNNSNVWEHVVIDLDALATKAGISYTDTMVIKFQYYGDHYL
jgi:hypothetical protein